MPRYLACAALFLAGLVPFPAVGLGLGEIDLKSGLNQPFVAEIAVTSKSANELTGLDVKLASRETFNQFGLDRPAFLTDFRFETVTRDGSTRVRITSVKSVVEPFVTLLLEIKWPQGRLLREYTVLLDPPAFGAADVEPAIQEPVAGPEAIPEPEQIVRSPAPEPVEPVPAEPAPVAVTAPAPTEPEPMSAIPTEPALVDTEAPAAAESTPARFPEASSPAPSAPIPSNIPQMAGDESFVEVKRNDTLWAIAGRASTATAADRNQIMLAIYEANPEAFVGNINRLKAGRILRIPQAGEQALPDRRVARVEVQRQNREWKETTVDGARLRLVPPPEEAAGQSSMAQTGSAAATSAGQEALQRRIGELEAELSDNRRLIAVRDEELQALQARLTALQERLDAANVAAAAEPAVPEEPSAEPPIFGEPEAIVEPVPEPVVEAEPIPSDVVTTTTREEEPSWIGALFTNVWLYVSLVVVVLLALFIVRRRPAAEPADDNWADLVADVDDAQTEMDATPLTEFRGDPTTTSAAFVVEEEVPSEATIQNEVLDQPDEIPDQPDEIPDRIEAEFATDLGEVFADVPDAELDQELLDELTGDHLAATPPEPESEPEPEPEPETEPEEAAESPYESAGMDTELPFERTISIPSPANLDEADPIAEADFHMAYGLYDQAAALLTDAIAADPDQKELRLKLLEVYFIWENAEEFLREVQTIKAHLGGDSDPDWNKVIIMGKQICPDEPMFSTDVDVHAQTESLDLALSDDSDAEGEYDVDIPLADAAMYSDEEAEAPDVDIAGVGESDSPDVLDFDIDVEDEAAQDDDDVDDTAVTVETPTIEEPILEPTSDASEYEPTVDIMALEPTVETPSGEFSEAEASTMESPGIDISSLEPTLETPTIKTEIALRALDEAGLDFTMDDADSDEDDLLSISSADLAAETLQVELEDDTQLSDIVEEAGLGGDDDSLNVEPTDLVEKVSLGEPDGTIEQLIRGDTTEQPGAIADNVRTLETTEGSIGEASTMTEVGTKLDLARAYIDMGDPEGARSILNEVLEEAGDSQRQEARQLLSGLG